MPRLRKKGFPSLTSNSRAPNYCRCKEISTVSVELRGCEMAKPIEQTEAKGEIAGAYLAAGDVEAANKALNDCTDRLRRQFKNPKEYDKHLQAFFAGMHKSDPDDVHLSKDHK